MQEQRETFWAYLFLFFLGGFGAHKFYLGRPHMGFLYMFTCGILGIGLVYDFFTLPFQVAACNAGIPAQTQTQQAHNCCCTCGQ